MGDAGKLKKGRNDVNEQLTLFLCSRAKKIVNFGGRSHQRVGNKHRPFVVANGWMDLEEFILHFLECFISTPL